MSIAILFESHEWSSFALYDKLAQYVDKTQIQLYDLQTEVADTAILQNDLIVSRIFASSQFRGHQRALERAASLLLQGEKLGKRLINSAAAHFYEIDKSRTASVLTQHKLPTPKVFGLGSPKDSISNFDIAFPLIIKPNCGGRTTDTHVVTDIEALQRLWSKLNPDVMFILEEYITPKDNTITRVEVIDGQCVQILKKSLTDTGLAAYHLGSTYTDYSHCSEAIKALALKTMDILTIEMGSIDIIESADGPFVIDVNSVSNYAEENIEQFRYDLIDAYAQYIASVYQKECSQ